MASNDSAIKQIACGRRKPNMTRSEYFTYRFQTHGAISDAPEEPKEKPAFVSQTPSHLQYTTLIIDNLRTRKYVQTQIFDSAFGPRANGPLNANHAWCGRDDVTELFFNDIGHLKSTFSSDWVKQKVGPDGPFFADFETTMVLLARESPLQLPFVTTPAPGAEENTHDNPVAMYFVSTPTNEREGAELEKTASPALVAELRRHAAGDVTGLVVNVGTLSEEFDLNAYFGGASMPQFALVYKILLKSPRSVAAVRKAQVAFEEEMGTRGQVDASESFIVFGKEALVLDVGRNIKVSHALYGLPRYLGTYFQC